MLCPVSTSTNTWYFTDGAGRVRLPVPPARDGDCLWSCCGPATCSNLFQRGIQLPAADRCFGKLFDKGVLGLTADRTITVSARFVGRTAAARDMVLSLAGRPVRGPQSGMERFEAAHVDWHGRQVFRLPSRNG